MTDTTALDAQIAALVAQRAAIKEKDDTAALFAGTEGNQHAIDNAMLRSIGMSMDKRMAAQRADHPDAKWQASSQSDLVASVQKAINSESFVEAALACAQLAALHVFEV